MGTYADHSHCELFWVDLGTLSSTTEPTDTNTDTQITHFESQLENAARLRGYTIPLSASTNPDSFLVARHAIVNAATAWVLMQRGFAGDIGDPSTPVGMMWQHWQEFLEGVRTISGYLQDATIATGGDELPVRKPFTSLFVADSTAVDDRAFERGDKY